MGRLIVARCLRDPAVRLVAALVRPGHALVGSDVGIVAGGTAAGTAFSADWSAALAADVLIDFSTPDGTRELLARAGLGAAAWVIGTTGSAPEERAALDAQSAVRPVLVSANTGLGIHLLRDLVRRAARVLGPDYDCEIVEFHHRRKRDAPSGTAHLLAAAAAEGKGLDWPQAGVFGRSGDTGPRVSDTIGVHAVRAGAIVGEHRVLFASDAERVEFAHTAETPDVFAAGAVKAALWLASRAPGRYGMEHVVADALALALHPESAPL